jgi:hypothetical protein
MFKFEIVAANEIGVPEPDSSKWPFRDMAQGQMVRYPMGTEEEKEIARKAQRYSHSYGRRTGKRFSTKAAETDGKKYMYIKYSY